MLSKIYTTKHPEDRMIDTDDIWEHTALTLELVNLSCSPKVFYFLDKWLVILGDFLSFGFSIYKTELIV